MKIVRFCLFIGLGCLLEACVARNVETTEFGLVGISIGSGTKAGAHDLAASEQRISNYEVLFFDQDQDGLLTSVVSASPNAAGPSLEVPAQKVRVGNYHVYALVNSDFLGQKNALYEKDFLALKLDLPIYNGHDDLIQHSEMKSLELGEDGADLDFAMKRYVSKVHLNSVQNSLGTQLSLKAIYLSNVLGNQNVAGNMSASVWYHQYGLALVPSDPERNAITVSTGCEPAALSLGKTVASGSTASLSDAKLYCYPNTLNLRQEDTYDGVSPFVECCTYFILEAVAASDGKTRYYQFPIAYNAEDKLGIEGALKANCSYGIDITIKALGAEVITDLSTDGTLEVKVTVLDWDTMETYTYDI